MITSGKRNLSIIIGVVLWFVAAMTVHLLSWTFDGALRSVLHFAIGIPLAFVVVRVSAAIVKPERSEVLAMVVWGLIPATLLDALGVSFFPFLYDGISAATQFGLAWIIWLVGLFLFFGVRAGAK